MKRSLILLFSISIPILAAAVKVGTFPAEIRHSFTTAQGLPSAAITCVAVTGSTIYAGTAHGLAVSSDGRSWRALTSQPVEACTASGSQLYFTSQAGLYRLSAGKAEKLAPLAGTPTAIAARGATVYAATSQGLYAGAKPLRLPAPKLQVRQLALDSQGRLAVAADEGLFLREASGAWSTLYPRSGARSWAPFDSRGVVFDAQDRLWVATPQGAGCLDKGAWRLFTGVEGLPYDDFTTLALGEPGVLWFGTRRGAIRYDGKTWAYRQGRRWLPADEVRSIGVASNGNAWFATPEGVGLIERKPITLAEKAKFFEDEIDKRHRRTPYGYVMAVQLPKAGDKSEWTQHDSDNDGLWTSMYGAGECFAYAATRDPLAKQRARKAFEALRFLSEVTQGGEHPAPPGFPARAILPTSGPDPNVQDSKERDIRNRAHHDHLWKIMSPRWPRSADGKWYWKTDTSSDELDGHFFFYGLYYDLVAETAQEKDDVRKLVAAITDHLLDHNYALVDWDGKPTRWAIFDPVTLNKDHAWWEGRGLNSLSILSYLKVAEHVTGNARYRRAYDSLVKEHNYDTNLMVPKIQVGPGSGNQSDDEMAFMSYYGLLSYETDPILVQKYAYSLFNYWTQERMEMNPFFNFVAASRLKGKSFSDAFATLDLTPRGDWLDDSLDTLRRLPLDRVDWRHQNSHRKDIVPIRSFLAGDDEDDRRGIGYRRLGKVLPADERFFEFWNHNPYRLNTGGNGHSLGDGAVFLLPYYMGLYHQYLEN